MYEKQAEHMRKRIEAAIQGVDKKLDIHIWNRPHHIDSLRNIFSFYMDREDGPALIKINVYWQQYEPFTGDQLMNWESEIIAAIKRYNL